MSARDTTPCGAAPPPLPQPGSGTPKSSSDLLSGYESGSKPVATEVGAKLKQGQSFGTIESVKAVSELYTPVTGEVVEVNTALKDKPEAVNKDPHGSWMIVLKLTNPSETGGLMDASKYVELTK